MESKPARENPVQRRARILRKWRLRKILRTIPKETTGRNVIRFFRYAALAASLGKQDRARAVYPWQPRNEQRYYRNGQPRAPRPDELVLQS